MTNKPFWEPTQTLASMAHGASATIEPGTNWGVPMGRNGSRSYSVRPSWLTGALTSADVRFIAGLELDPHYFNPTMCALFKQLVQALPAAQRPSDRVQETWVAELFGLLPSCIHDHTRYYDANSCALEYIELSVAPLLLPLHTLLLRDGFWLRQIEKYTPGQAECGESSTASPAAQLLAESGYSLSELAGDPSGITYPTRQLWSTDLMDAREALFSRGHREGDKINTPVQDLLFTLDVMAQVVATLEPGLHDRMIAYRRWTAQI